MILICNVEWLIYLLNNVKIVFSKPEKNVMRKGKEICSTDPFSKVVHLQYIKLGHSFFEACFVI